MNKGFVDISREKMEQQAPGQQQPVMGVVSGPPQMPYGTAPYQTAQLVAPVAPASVVGAVQSPGQPASAYPATAAQLAAQHQLAYQHLHQQQQQQQQQQLQIFLG